MVLRAGVEVEDVDADADVLGEPRTMLETFGWIARRFTVCGRSDGWLRESCGLPRTGEFVRGRNGLASESSRCAPPSVECCRQASSVNDRRRNFVVELLMTV